MLAQNFKTAIDLGISDVELDALIKVLGMLEREEIPFAPSPMTPSPPEDYDTTPTHFNMILVKTETDCGTAACLCGWARDVAKNKELFCRTLPVKVSALFYMGEGPCDISCSIGQIKPDQAATALRSFLRTGDANWREAIGVS